LVVGVVPVRLLVDGPVASVELVLDGLAVGTVSGPAWSGAVDLGTAIAPHELLARGLGKDREELVRARQWLNLPRPPAEVEILLERNPKGLATGAALSWESLTGEQPKSVRASFNGKALSVSKDHSVRLPTYDPEEAQLLTVELEFENAVRARKDLVFGGRAGEQAESELTAVPVHVSAGGKTPSPAMLQGVLRSGGGPLDVVAVEEGAGILLVVRDSVARGLGRYRFEGSLRMLQRDMLLDRHSTVRFVWPRPATYPGSGLPVELFPVSRELDASTGGLRWMLTRVFNPQPEPQSPRFADAVAVASLNGYGAFRRRAVLLVLAPEDHDASQYSAGMVRRFLASLRVPLFVWSLGPPVGPVGSAWAWTEAVDVSSEDALKAEFAKIKVELEAQRIVWVAGKILPQDITLPDESGSIELVR
jgi:hypothetical protein